MSFTFFSHSLRQILPREEIRVQDRRPGAYPVKSKTGDKTRTGRNKIYFDDARSVMFMTGVNITYPTTRQFDSNWVGIDLTGTLGNVTGNVDPYAVDQFIIRPAQNERVGAFFDTGLFEQDETNVTNSSFMTGAAFGIAPDRFKSKISNKTAVRMEFPLVTKSTLSVDSSSMHYFNPTVGTFEKIADEHSLNVSAGTAPGTFAPVLFTPYGMHYLPINNSLLNNFGTAGTSLEAKVAYKRVITYSGDGSDDPFFPLSAQYLVLAATASLVNTRHSGSVAQSIDMSTYLSHPFLLEKIVVEFPFQAGPGWLNDRFGIREALADDLSYTIDAGGPMITFALLRRDGADGSLRDLIASGTITTQIDMQTGSYKISTSTYAGVGGYSDIIATPEGVGYFINPSVVISGSVVSGSDNFYTGSIKFIMDPQITSHTFRQRVSGSATFYFGVGNTSHSARNTQAIGISYGPISRRSSKYMESGRNILGNHFALVPPSKLDGALNPIVAMDTQYEDGAQVTSAPRAYKSKAYYDVVSKTTKSPYLLYPEDRLILAISKHRSVATDDSTKWDFTTNTISYPSNLTSYHDVAIGAGLMKMTLYGDLIKEDKEFHDTLNQRFETEELWQDIGEDPVFDQFDVAYRGELSGCYLDRYSVLGEMYYARDVLTGSLQVTQLYSNFSSAVKNERLSNFASWSYGKHAYELAKSNRNSQMFSTNEIYWDSRLVNPSEVLKIANSNYGVCTSDYATATNSVILYTGTAQILAVGFPSSGRGINEWVMGFPYESKFSGVSSAFNLGKDILKVDFGPKTVFDYNDIAFEFGDTTNRAIMCGDLGITALTNVIPQPKNEFIKYFYGIGDGYGKSDNQHVRGRLVGTAGTNFTAYSSARIRGWKYGMVSGFAQHSKQLYRRNRYGQPRDLLEQRLDTKYYDELGLSSDGIQNGVVGVKDGPIKVFFYDFSGNQTDPLNTLSSNLSNEATSSVPYTDGQYSNRPAYDLSLLNILNVNI